MFGLTIDFLAQASQTQIFYELADLTRRNNLSMGLKNGKSALFSNKTAKPTNFKKL